MINAKELAAEVEKEILSARSTSVPILRAIRKNISQKIKLSDRQIVIETALALISRNRVHRFIPYEVGRKLETGRKDGRRTNAQSAKESRGKS